MSGLVPDDWMPSVPMSRIHVHWSAGTHKAGADDLKSYHILVEGDGRLVRGNKSIANNARGGSNPASHTLNANTGAIGLSMCCMSGAKESPFNPGSFPMTKVQWDRMTEVAAVLAERYTIRVTPITILTHAEVQPNLNIQQRQKWDVTRLAFDDTVKGHMAVGNRMRTQIAGHINAGPSGPVALPKDSVLPKFKVSGVAPDVLNVRDAPNGTKIGALAEGTRVERLAVIDTWWRVRLANGTTGWVFSSFLKPV